ncbi:hypothetical protein WUBG_18541, partial [Wuchereria bancrofti]
IESRATMLGRIPNSLSKVREMPLSSKQMGNRTNKITNVEGRVIFDVIQMLFESIRKSITLLRIFRCKLYNTVGRIRPPNEKGKQTYLSFNKMHRFRKETKNITS